MNNKASIAFALVTALAVTAFGTPDAHADLADDRVMLQDGSAFGCTGTGSRGFYRVFEDPDGGQTYSTTTEFRVPAGYYLEIGTIEYQLPMYMKWALHYTNTLNIGIRRRVAWDSTNEWVAPGAQTNTVSFPHGPLMGNGGRLCASAPTSFWANLGFTSVRIRGRLVPTGSPVIVPEPPTSSL